MSILLSISTQVKLSKLNFTAEPETNNDFYFSVQRKYVKLKEAESTV